MLGLLKYLNRKSVNLAFTTTLFLTLILLAGCGPEIKPTTGLYEKGTHTGTVTSFRVDNDICGTPNPEARFVRVRHKMDINDLLCSESIVTNQDNVTIALTSAFIKYFKETGAENRKGEIALVMSFESGTESIESILIHSSQGQTLGSFLNLEDWPIIGPLNIDGDSLKIRLVMIELDKSENERTKNWIRQISGFANTVDPGIAAVTRIAQPIVDAIIDLNHDDVILDQRFALQRVTPAKTPTRSPLLYGKYILVLQEDRFRSADVNDIAQRATEPVKTTDLRFDLHSDHLYKAYNYYPFPRLPIVDDEEEEITIDEPEEEKEEKKNVIRVIIKAENNYSALMPIDFPIEVSDPDFVDIDGVTYDFRYNESLPTLFAGLFEGTGPIDYSGFYAWTDAEAKEWCAPYEYWEPLLKNWVNRKATMDRRRDVLGYDNDGKLGDLELYSCLDKVLKTVYDESKRGISNKSGGKPAWTAGERYPFEYPVTQYPEAYSVLAQYPLHTHLVFTVDRSLGGEGSPAHERLKSYTEFLEEEISRAKDEPATNELFTSLKSAFESNRRERVLLSKLGAESDKTAKACILYDALPVPVAAGGSVDDAVGAVNSALIYNELFHTLSEVFTEQAEVKAHLLAQTGCEADANGEPSCCQ